MLQNLEDLAELAKKPLEEFNAFCIEHELLGKVVADHIGFKCGSSETYVGIRAALESKVAFLYQSIISNRRISILGLPQGLPSRVGPLNYLQLSDQKPDGSQVDGIDHLEIVPLSVTYEGLLADLQARHVKMKEIIRPHHITYDIVLPSGFIIKLSREMLLDKIKREEMK